MLNLTQRLILGCTLLVCLMAGLVAITHRALAAAGLTSCCLCAFCPFGSGCSRDRLPRSAARFTLWQATHIALPRETWNTALSGAAATTLA